MAGNGFWQSSSSKKTRKPYTITKSRESWSDEDHDKFLEALHLFGRDWKKIKDYVGSKTVIQIRSHAQKYFMKIQKSDVVVHVPPPRPKRKAAHPYPQKAINNGSIIRPSTLSCVAVGLSQLDDSAMLMNTTLDGSMSSQKEYSYPYAFDDSTVSCLGNNSFSESSASSLQSYLGNNSFSGSSTLSLQISDMPKQGSLHHEIPDFSELYSFIGSVFDPDTTGHMKKLKKMNPINLKTVLLLMRNLTINLSTPSFGSTGKVLPMHDGYATTKLTTGFTARNQCGYK